MKRLRIKCIGLFSLAALSGGFFSSCTETLQDTSGGAAIPSGIVCRTVLREETADNDMLTKLYVFSKREGEDYQLSDSLPEVINGLTKLKLDFAKLDGTDYRFLFVATPITKPEIQVKCIDNSSFDFGTKWEDMAIEMATDSLSVDNYYGIRDIPGEEIKTMTTIEGELTRLVGQMVFCFYKVGPGGIKDTVTVDDPEVASVFDRVSSIDVKYEGVPRLIKFDMDNKPVSVSGSEIVLNHVVCFSPDEELKVDLSKENESVKMDPSIPDGAILKGTCLLPSQNSVRVSMFFHYYDTTPICESTGPSHKHGVACYKQQSISLHLPKEQELSGLSVIPDNFTVNKAGVPCSRIIDVRHTSGLEINTEWKDSLKLDEKEQ